MSGWRAIDGQEAAALEEELRRELPAGHVLHGRQVRAIARRDDCDDVAFEVVDAGLCIVHLTYERETDPLAPPALFVERLPESGD